MRRSLLAAALAPLAVLVPLATPAAAVPTTFVVTSPAATGPGTLDQAIADANTNPGRDTIRFDLERGVHEVVAAPDGRSLRITDAVVIDACADDGDPLTDPGVLLQPGASTGPTLLIDAPDVTVQGVSIPGAVRPVDVTSAGDRFVYRNAVVSGNPATFRVTGAEDVVIGGPGATGCVGDGGVILLGGATAGFELVDTIGARLEDIFGRNFISEAVLVTGGQGTQLLDLSFEGQAFDGIPMIRLDGAGTATAPVRYVGGRINHCRGDCLLVANGSHLDLGAPGVLTELVNNLGRPAVPIRVEASSASIHDAYIHSGQLAGIVIGAGAFDTTVARTNVGDNRGDGIRLEGTPAPRNVRLTGNFIGYLSGDDVTAPAPFGNHDLGIQVDAADGLRIDGNVISANRTGGIELHDAASKVTIAGNRIGSDPTTEQQPGPVGNPAVQPFGIRAGGADGLRIDGNVIAGNGGPGVILAETHGAVIQSNRIGTDATGTVAAPNDGDGILLAADDVEIIGNTIGGNDGHGVGAAGGSERLEVRANRIGGTAIRNAGKGVVLSGSDAVVVGNDVGANDGAGIEVWDGLVEANTVTGSPTGIVVHSGSTVRGNRLGVRPDGSTGPSVANVVGIDVLADDNLIVGNLVTNTTTSNAAVVVRGQRNRITAASVFGNAGHAIDLIGDGNGGILPPVPTAAAAIVLEDTMRVTGTTPGTTSGTVDVYGNRACGPNDHEAEHFLGRITVTNGSFNGAVLRPLFGATQLTLTVTDGDGDTSELSSCLAYTGTPRKAPKPTTPPPPPPFPPVFPTP